MERLETLQSLDQVLSYRLVLVTTCLDSETDRLDALLDEWSGWGEVRISRLRLKAAHNDPWRFLQDLNSVAKIDPLDPPPARLEDGLIDLLNIALGVGQDFVLLLTNYHVIHNNDIHAAVGLILNYMPPRMHLILTSREPPPLPIPRLRVRAQMREMRL